MSSNEHAERIAALGETPAETFDMRIFERAVENRRQIIEAEARLRALKEERDELEGKILDVFASGSMDSGTFDGMTVYPYSDMRVSVKGGMMKDFCNVMRRLGYEEVVKETVNANTLTSIVKSMVQKDGDEVPPEMEALINIHRRYKIGYRQR